jgi:hypothetical protein
VNGKAAVFVINTGVFKAVVETVKDVIIGNRFPVIRKYQSRKGGTIGCTV